MASKREREDPDVAASEAKRKKTGFRVGPANLPDGTYRRKAQKIKRTLIQKAKIRASYAKIKAQEPHSQRPPALQFLGSKAHDRRHDGEEASSDEAILEPASNEPHPSRQLLISSPPENPGEEHDAQQESHADRKQRFRRSKPAPFAKESNRAERAKEAAAKKRKEIAASKAERERKLMERERWRKAMEKSKRPGPDGKLKLGKQSKLLLEKIKSMVTEE